jgi:hypothetical protein
MDNWIQFNWVRCNLPMYSEEVEFSEPYPDIKILEARFVKEFGQSIDESRDKLGTKLSEEWFRSNEILTPEEKERFKPVIEHHKFVWKYYDWIDSQPEVIEYERRKKEFYKKQEADNPYFYKLDLLKPGTLLHLRLANGSEKYVLIGHVNKHGIGNWSEPESEEAGDDLPPDSFVIRYAILELPKVEDVK